MTELEKIIEELKGRVVPGVYKITNPKGAVYVGSAVNIRNRFRQYKRLSCKTQPKIYNSLIKYGISCHKFEILEECFHTDKKSLNEILNNREIFWGNTFDVTSIKNLTLKLGTRNCVVSQETKDKISASKKYKGKRSQPIIQYDLSGVFIRDWVCISEANDALGLSDGFISRCCTGDISKAAGYIWRYKFGNNVQGFNVFELEVPVLQYTLSGEVIREWSSISLAKRSVPGCSKIIEACRGSRPQAGGFIWRYKNDDSPIIPVRSDTYRKPVVQYTIKGSFVQEFRSAAEAQECIPKATSITAVCKGKFKTSGGFIWKYKNK